MYTVSCPGSGNCIIAQVLLGRSCHWIDRYASANPYRLNTHAVQTSMRWESYRTGWLLSRISQNLYPFVHVTT